jgi:hypothetical protein
MQVHPLILREASMHLSQIGRMDAFEARVFGGIGREHARMSGLLA